jgi:hypothetical protein
MAGLEEPTRYPRFLELAQGVLGLKRHFFSYARLGLVSDASRVFGPGVGEAYELFDEKIVRWDASHQAVHRLKKISVEAFDFEQSINALRNLRGIFLQSYFVGGDFDNTSHEEVDEWVEMVGFIQPKGVRVTTPGAEDAGVKKVPYPQLKEFAEACQSMTGVPSSVDADSMKE